MVSSRFSAVQQDTTRDVLPIVAQRTQRDSLNIRYMRIFIIRAPRAASAILSCATVFMLLLLLVRGPHMSVIGMTHMSSESARKMLAAARAPSMGPPASTLQLSVRQKQQQLSDRHLRLDSESAESHQPPELLSDVPDTQTDTTIIIRDSVEVAVRSNIPTSKSQPLPEVAATVKPQTFHESSTDDLSVCMDGTEPLEPATLIGYTKGIPARCATSPCAIYAPLSTVRVNQHYVYIAIVLKPLTMNLHH